jgi:hypothetical protein
VFAGFGRSASKSCTEKRLFCTENKLKQKTVASINGKAAPCVSNAVRQVIQSSKTNPGEKSLTCSTLSYKDPSIS